MEKVRQGEAVSIKASTWNAFVDAANWVKERRQNTANGGLSAGMDVGIIRVKNAESTDAERFSALVLTGIAVTPESNEDEFVSCPPVFTGKRMTTALEGRPYCVLQEPIAAGEIGRAMILGLTPAQVSVSSQEHAFAEPKPNDENGALRSAESGVARILWSEGGTGAQWTLLQLGGAGSGGSSETALICRVTGGRSDRGYSVEVYADGMDKESYDATLFLPDVAMEAEIPYGTLIVGHRSLLYQTGGSET